VWAPIFEAFSPVRQWLEERKPDVLFFIYNDHVTSFFFDHYSAFTLGVGEQYAVADEGGGARDLPPIAGHPALARHIGESLVADEFDMSFFQDRALDHGVFSPLSVLCAHDRPGPLPIIPLQVGVLQSPSPSARRCYKLGPGAAPRHRKLPRRHFRRDRRDRRRLAPGARRTRRLQQHGLGRAVPGPG
jgi:gallate dioxygenase